MFQIESIIYNIMEYLEFPNDEIIVSRTKKRKISQNEPTYNDPSLKKINIFSKYSLVSKLWYKVEQKIRCKFCFGINQCIIINNKNIIKCVKCGHTIGTLPANTRIKNLMITSSSVITTAGNNGNDLDFSLGVSDPFNQIITPKAIASGAAVTISAATTYFLIKDFLCTGQDLLDATGATATGKADTNPATSAAIVIESGEAVDTVDRALTARLTPLVADLAAGDSANITFVIEYLSAFN